MILPSDTVLSHTYPHPINNTLVATSLKGDYQTSKTSSFCEMNFDTKNSRWQFHLFVTHVLDHFHKQCSGIHITSQNFSIWGVLLSHSNFPFFLFQIIPFSVLLLLIFYFCFKLFYFYSQPSTETFTQPYYFQFQSTTYESIHTAPTSPNL